MHYFARSQSPSAFRWRFDERRAASAQIRIIKIADLLIAKFSADAAAVRRYGKSGLAFKFAPIALYFAIKIYEILFSVGAKKFYKAPF